MTMNSTSTFEVAKIEQLRANLAGAVYLPGDEGYNEARMPWNLSYAAQRPALVVSAANAADVAAAIHFANEQDLGIALQTTGHGVIHTADDALLINTSAMNKVIINADQGTAIVEGGAVWGDVLGPAQEAGLAPLLGSSPGAGAVGYTLGGGIGWLARKYGLAADSVRYFDVVTADGRQRRASAQENSDLFWALCGGRTTFAVVTGMEIDLVPVSMVYGGSIIYPAAMARGILERYREWIATLPEELTSSIVLMNVPPLPDIPEMLQGKSVVMVRACYCGPMEEAESHFQTWLEGPQPMANFLGPLPFSQVAMISQDPEQPLPGYLTGAWIDSLDDDVLDALINHTYSQNGPPPVIFSEVRHVGGTKAEVDPGKNAVDHRGASLLLNVLGMTPTPEISRQVTAYIKDYLESIEDHQIGVYPNFLEGPEAQEVIHKAFRPETYGRLKAVKERYDPQNRFRYGLEFR